MTFVNPVKYIGGNKTSNDNEGDNSDFIPYPGTPVKRGSIGNNVIDVQTRLTALGFTFTAEERGVFGVDTENIVKIYQGQNTLDVTGVVEAKTWQKLFGKAPKVVPDSQRTANLASYVLQSSASYTMDASSQVTLTYLDPGYKQLAAGHFSLRRILMHRGLAFEIAAIETKQGDGGSPIVTVEARSAAIQAMKRDKKPEAYQEMKASDFAIMIAGRYGMRAFVEPTQKVQTIVKAKNPQSDESTWTVLTRLANDNQYVCFESDNVLFFCSQQYLLGKIGNILLRWPPIEVGGRISSDVAITGQDIPYPGSPIKIGSLGNNVLDLQDRLLTLGYIIPQEERNTFGLETEAKLKLFQAENRLPITGVADLATWEKLFGKAVAKAGASGSRAALIGTPEMRRSDDEALEASGSATVDRATGIRMRAGQTVRISGVPGFNGAYLITEVRFDDNSPDPVQIFFRTPQKPKAK